MKSAIPFSKSSFAAEACVVAVRTEGDAAVVREALWPDVDLAEANTQLRTIIAK
jgi:hypothetical protein